GIIPLSALDVSGASGEYGNAYVGTDPALFREMVGRLPIRHDDFVFIDFGSGKGRCLLLATEWPFRRIVGVELSAELNHVARENIRRFQSRAPHGQPVESVCTDAASYRLPRKPLVCYFFNPFRADVMAAVADHFARSLAQHPRDLFVVYHHPVERAC